MLVSDRASARCCYPRRAVARRAGPSPRRRPAARAAPARPTPRRCAGRAAARLPQVRRGCPTHAGRQAREPCGLRRPCPTASPPWKRSPFPPNPARALRPRAARSPPAGRRAVAGSSLARIAQPPPSRRRARATGAPPRSAPFPVVDWELRGSAPPRRRCWGRSLDLDSRLRAHRYASPRMVTVCTLLPPPERARVDAAGDGCFATVHAESPRELLRAARRHRVDALVISVHRCGGAELPVGARFVREVPALPAGRLVSRHGRQGAGTLLRLRGPRGRGPRGSTVAGGVAGPAGPPRAPRLHTRG